MAKKGCHKLSGANGRGLAMVSFIGFSTKGSRDEAIDECKPRKSPMEIFFFPAEVKKPSTTEHWFEGPVCNFQGEVRGRA